MLELEQYTERVKCLTADNNLTSSDIIKVIKEELKDYPDINSKNKRTFFAWASGTWFFPPIEVVSVLANIFGVSVGYLLGQHPVKTFDDANEKITIDMKSIAEEFKKEHQMSIWRRQVNCQWMMSLSENKLTNTRPFYRFAETVGYTIDYCLGQTAVKHWQQYAFDKGLYDLLPDNTLFVIPAEELKNTEFALLTEPKKSKPNNRVLLNTGKTTTMESIKEKDAKVVISVKYD